MSGFKLPSASVGLTYSPSAFLNRLSSSSWIAGLTLPSRRIAIRGI